MLNLQQISKTKKLYEIKMWDGEVLTLKMPSQRLLQDLMGLQAEMDDPMQVIGTLYQLLTDILNLNTQGIKYAVEQLSDELDLPTAVLVIQDYMTNTTKILGE